MNNVQKNELVIAVAEACERLVSNITTNPAFNFANDSQVWEVLASYSDLRDSDVPPAAAYAGVMRPVELERTEEVVALSPVPEGPVYVHTKDTAPVTEDEVTAKC